MSSWIADWWERGVIPVKGEAARYRTHCKLGQHAIYQATPAHWLKDPMGLSCEPCMTEAGIPVPAAAPAVPKPRKAADPSGPGRTHGKPGTYAAGCRCRPCTEAATIAQARYREKRRARAAAAQELAGAEA